MSDTYQLWVAARRVREDTVLQAWSRDAGHTDTQFKVHYNTPSRIVVEIDNGNLRSISKNEFLRIASLWEDYRNGHGIRPNHASQNTSYIFGILEAAQ